METIKVRYGESLNLSIVSDDITATDAQLFVGKAGENPVLTTSAAFVEGVANFNINPGDWNFPLGEYKYQINVNYSDGQLKKFPAPEDCEEGVGLPSLVVYEALDSTEVS